MRFLDGWATEIARETGGYYVTVIGAKGEDVHQTGLCATEQAAINAAAQYTKTHTPPKYRR